MSEPQVYQFSVKLESTAKGLIMPTVHVFGNNLEAVRMQAVQQYEQVVADLRAKGLSVASEGKAA